MLTFINNFAEASATKVTVSRKAIETSYKHAENQQVALATSKMSSMEAVIQHLTAEIFPH
jgi:hypothetical protein